jgi:hypothetical protein
MEEASYLKRKLEVVGKLHMDRKGEVQRLGQNDNQGFRLWKFDVGIYGWAMHLEVSVVQ